MQTVPEQVARRHRQQFRLKSYLDKLGHELEGSRGVEKAKRLAQLDQSASAS
jgi:hypothetical protein